MSISQSLESLELNLYFHNAQRTIFFGADTRNKIVATGRRFGKTKGLANYVMLKMIENVSPILWVDTINSNIDRYLERYFIPVLKPLPSHLWQWRQQKKELKILNSICDFRSSDQPDNIEGFGYALIILNEAGIILNNSYLWFNAIRPMVMDYHAQILACGTPKGKKAKKQNGNSLFYELFQKGDPESPTYDLNYKSFHFTSYANVKPGGWLDKAEIDELAADTPPSIRRQEIYGEFVDIEAGEILKREWWKFYRELPANYDSIVQSYDTAYKKNEENSFSVCTTWYVTGHGYYLADCWRERVEFPELKRQVAMLYNKYRPREILIEDMASGQSLIQELRRSTALPIKPIKVDRDKIARVNAISPMVEAGNVFVPENAPWVADWIDEMGSFPQGEHDDMCDSLSMFLNYMRENEMNGEPYAQCLGIPTEASRILKGY